MGVQERPQTPQDGFKEGPEAPKTPQEAPEEGLPVGKGAFLVYPL